MDYAGRIAELRARMAGKGGNKMAWVLGLGAFVVIGIVVLVLVLRSSSSDTTPSQSSSTPSTPSTPPPSNSSTPPPPPPPPPPPAAPTGKSIRYISISARRPDYLNIAELQAFDAAGNKISGTPHVHPQYLHFGANLFNDGDVSTFAHTTNVMDAYLHFDLGSDKMVHKVKIENRRDACCRDRIESARVSMRNAADQELCSHVIREIKDTYEIDLTQTPCTMNGT